MRPFRLIACLAALFLAAARPATALENGLARTPPMGWNSWRHFGCSINEALVRQTADAMIANGMREAGYAYVVVDDCWQGERDRDGAIHADPVRFPSGIKALADYVHARGLRFGLYSDAGSRTCEGRPGSLGHEEQDARTYADWGVDFLKYDWCFAAGLDAPSQYARMRDALVATGRPILFSICEWGVSDPARWAPPVGNMWRTTGDVVAAFQQAPVWRPQHPPKPAAPGAPAVGVLVATNGGVLEALDGQVGLGRFAGPGGWNDPDTLAAGEGRMSLDEQKAQFALWAILAAPLIAGNDVREMAPEVRSMLLDPEVIAIDQDAKGRPGDRVRRYAEIDIWARPLAGGAEAAVLLNRGAEAVKISVGPAMFDLPYAGVCVRDVSAHIDRGALGERLTLNVRPRSVVVLKLALGARPCPATGTAQM
jgi:alpha-galactosidase